MFCLWYTLAFDTLFRLAIKISRFHLVFFHLGYGVVSTPEQAHQKAEFYPEYSVFPVRVWYLCGSHWTTAKFRQSSCLFDGEFQKVPRMS